jgi:hypothetical protein
MKLSCILSFGCSNLRYVTTRVISGGMMDDDKIVEVHKCLDCGREVLRENDR